MKLNFFFLDGEKLHPEGRTLNCISLYKTYVCMQNLQKHTCIVAFSGKRDLLSFLLGFLYLLLYLLLYAKYVSVYFFNSKSNKYFTNL